MNFRFILCIVTHFDLFHNRMDESTGFLLYVWVSFHPGSNSVSLSYEWGFELLDELYGVRIVNKSRLLFRNSLRWLQIQYDVHPQTASDNVTPLQSRFPLFDNSISAGSTEGEIDRERDREIWKGGWVIHQRLQLRFGSSVKIRSVKKDGSLLSQLSIIPKCLN